MRLTTKDRSLPTRVFLMLGLAALLAFSACGDDDDDDTGSYGGGDGGGGGGDGTLEITASSFSDLTAPAGGTVEVTNSSGTAHTFTAEDGQFDEEIADGDTVTIQVPDEPGDYDFHCNFHGSMQATLTVE